MKSQVDPKVRRRWQLRWVLVALVVVICGSTISLLAARDSASDAAAADQRAFERTALETASSLRSAIQHEQDLVVSTGAIFAANPDITTSELATWLADVDAHVRYPELVGVAAMRVVSDADLDQFEARLRKDPGVAMGPTGDLLIVPAGQRPSYCLLQAVVLSDPTEPTTVAGVDYCATEVGPLLAAARDSGTPSYLALPVDGATQLVVQAPIYMGGDDPGSPAVRRSRYLGSLGTSIAPAVLFANVLQGQTGIMITLSYDGGASSATFSSGSIEGDVQTVRQRFDNGWTAVVTQAAPNSGWWTFTDGLRVLVSGCVASIVLGIMLFVLGTGRRRALRLVARRTDELHHQALHDALTDLPNRALILDRAEHLLARCRRSGTVCAALFIDLDGFKDVNDTLGHEAGDQLLRCVAARLTTSLRGVDTIGRLGGDEFVVLVDEGSVHIGPELVAERLLDVLRQPFELALAPRPIVVTTSIGIATGDRASASDLLRDADIALYRAKGSGRNRYEVFRPEMEADVQRRFELEADLRVALELRQFELHYQPIYNLADLTVVGAEALIRWQHPTRGTIGPLEFIPRLEATGQIIEVGRWVLDQACRQAKQWQDEGHALTVSINVSAKQLEHDAIVEHIAEALATSGADPQRITLEITETVLMRNTELTISRLHALKDLGVTLAIDDFGTGYSSLAYLQRFPVDCLKIDRSFTDAITRTPESDALIHILVQLGKALGLTTLAEGIENTGQLDYLRGVQVDEAQGFLLARPLSAEDFTTRMLLTGPSPDAAVRLLRSR